MRGPDERQVILFSYRSIDERIPADHPLRAMRRLVDPLLLQLSPQFQRLYSALGRPSIPPEQLLRALLLQVLYTIRSERQLMEQLDYICSTAGLWASRRTIPSGCRPCSPRTGTGCWQATSPRRSFSRSVPWPSSTSSSRRTTSLWTAPCSKPGPSQELSPEGRAHEREAALALLHRRGRRRQRRTLGADKGYDTPDFIAGVRVLGFTPHVSPNCHRYRRRSTVDGRTTRHAGYAVRQRKRKLVEEAFGWQKGIGLLRKLHHREREKVSWIFAFTSAAYNLVRLRRLLAAAAT